MSTQPGTPGTGAVLRRHRLLVATGAVLLAFLAVSTAVTGQPMPPQQGAGAQHNHGPAVAAQQATVPREEALRRANEHARLGLLDYQIVAAQVTSAEAELITLAEADRRLGAARPAGYGPGRSENSPVWWVTVKGSFRATGRGPAGQAAPALTFSERVFLYDATNGDLIGMRVPAQ